VSTEANKALIEQVVAGHNRHDPEAVVALYSPDIANHGRPLGRDGMALLYRSLYTAFPDFRFDIQLLVSDDDWITAQLLMSGTHLGSPELPVLGGLLHGVPPTGRRVEVQNIHLYRIGEGLVAEHRAVRDDLGMMQQLGLLPATSHVAGDISRPAH
jgi:predicted ester cyclase